MGLDKIISGDPAGSHMRVEVTTPTGTPPGGAGGGGGGDRTYFATGTVDVAAWLMLKKFPLEMSQRIDRNESKFFTDFMFVHSERLMASVKDFYDGNGDEAKRITDYVKFQVRLRKDTREQNGVLTGQKDRDEFVCNKFDVAAWMMFKGETYLGVRSKTGGTRFHNWDYIFLATDATSDAAREFFIPGDEDARSIRSFSDFQADVRRIKKTMEKSYD